MHKLYTPGHRYRFFWGMVAGSPGKPQDYLCQSLGGVHVVVLGLFEREVAYMMDHLH